MSSTNIQDLISINDEDFNNISADNYINTDINGSVYICSVKCGHELEDMTDLTFSSLTNYGKIVSLNLDTNNTNNSKKCIIKLAQDNDNIYSYSLKKIFFTAPALNKINGTVYDFATYIVFSASNNNSININKNKYVCLCILNNVISTISNDDNDTKLINFKLLDSLFYTNSIPNINETSNIIGPPNPIDLNNFLPATGSRTFYEYSNNNVSFRIFQETMFISNNALNKFKSKVFKDGEFDTFLSSIKNSVTLSGKIPIFYNQDLSSAFGANLPPEPSPPNTNLESYSNDDNVDKALKDDNLDKSLVDNNLKNKNGCDDNNGECLDQPNVYAANGYIFLILGFLIVCNLLFYNVTYYAFNNYSFEWSQNNNEDKIELVKQILGDNDILGLLKIKIFYYITFLLKCFFIIILFIILLTRLSSTTSHVFNGLLGFVLVLSFISYILIIIYGSKRSKLGLNYDVSNKDSAAFNVYFLHNLEFFDKIKFMLGINVDFEKILNKLNPMTGGAKGKYIPDSYSKIPGYLRDYLLEPPGNSNVQKFSNFIDPEKRKISWLWLVIFIILFIVVLIISIFFQVKIAYSHKHGIMNMASAVLLSLNLSTFGYAGVLILFITMFIFIKNANFVGNRDLMENIYNNVIINNEPDPNKIKIAANSNENEFINNNDKITMPYTPVSSRRRFEEDEGRDRRYGTESDRSSDSEVNIDRRSTDNGRSRRGADERSGTESDGSSDSSVNLSRRTIDDGRSGPGAEGRPGPGAEGRPGPGPEGRSGPGPEGKPGPGAEGRSGPGPEGKPGPGADLSRILNNRINQQNNPLKEDPFINARSAIKGHKSGKYQSEFENGNSGIENNNLALNNIFNHDNKDSRLKERLQFKNNSLIQDRFSIKGKKMEDYQKQFEPAPVNEAREKDSESISQVLGSRGQDELNKRRSSNKNEKSQEYKSWYEQDILNKSRGQDELNKRRASNKDEKSQEYQSWYEQDILNKSRGQDKLNKRRSSNKDEKSQEYKSWYEQDILNKRRVSNKDAKSKEYQTQYEQSGIESSIPRSASLPLEPFRNLMNQRLPISRENKPIFKKHPRIKNHRNLKQNKATEYSDQYESD